MSAVRQKQTHPWTSRWPRRAAPFQFSLTNSVRRALLALIMAWSATISTPFANALPADFVGRYEILDSRQLSISGGAAYVIQDGQLILEIQRNRSRPFCRALATSFDETSGPMDVRFSLEPAGGERATLKTVPQTTWARSTTIECFSETGFFGALDLSIALGQIVRLSR